MTSVNLGSVPDWLAGSGAVLALFFARRAAKAAYETNKQQALQLEKLEEAEESRRITERQRHASNIAVWLNLDAESLHLPERWRMVVRYSNTSNQPIYELIIKPRIFSDKPEKYLRIPVLPPTSQSFMDDASTKLLTTDLQQQAKGACSQETVSVYADSGNERISAEYRASLAATFGSARDLGIDIEFMDAAGVNWRRDHRGRLMEIPSTVN